MRSVQIYIEGERDSNDYTEIELFNDEKIDINLSIQNIQDISKVIKYSEEPIEPGFSNGFKIS